MVEMSVCMDMIFIYRFSRRVQELPNECPNDTSDSVTAPVMQSSSAKLPAVKVEE